jgi:hypothetical protein
MFAREVPYGAQLYIGTGTVHENAWFLTPVAVIRIRIPHTWPLSDPHAITVF